MEVIIGTAISSNIVRGLFWMSGFIQPLRLIYFPCILVMNVAVETESLDIFEREIPVW